MFNTDESHAGFAANAYARTNGFGCVCTNYQIGTYKLVNSIACAYAERSPVIVISGSPGLKEKRTNTQFEVFKSITRSAYVLDNLSLAGFVIDKAFEELNYYKQPVYLELPRDLISKPINYDVYKLGTPKLPKTNTLFLEECIKEVIEKINQSARPIIVAGVELARYNLGNDLLRFIEEFNIPFITEVSSKSVIGERHQLFSGMYSSTNRDLVDKSDCVIMLGVILEELLVLNKDVVVCNIEETRVDNHYYRDIQFQDFCHMLFKQNINKFFGITRNQETTEFTSTNAKITVDTFVRKINAILTKNMIVVSDAEASLKVACNLHTPYQNQFISPAFYASTGFAIPGALGVQLAKSNMRPIVITTSSACRNSLPELSTCLQFNMNPIIFVLKAPKDTWQYNNIRALFGQGNGMEVTTELELDEACTQAMVSKELFVVSVCVPKL